MLGPDRPGSLTRGLVLCAAYRPAALTAKMISTLDVVSGGRAVLGIGAGWKQDEWLAYGYGFPDAPTRLAILADHLEVITRMLGPGRATYEGRHAQVRDALHEPKGLQPRISVVVGGSGPEGDLAACRPLRRRAVPGRADAGRRRQGPARDPGPLRGTWPRPRQPAGRGPRLGEAAVVAPGPARQGRLAEYAGLGVDRVVVQGFAAVLRPRDLDALVEDCAAVGLLEEPASGVGDG